MARYRLNHDTVVNGAVDLVNQHGSDALSLAELAARFRVRTPSLYNHIEGLDGLRRDLTLRGLNLLANGIRPAIAGVSGRDALQAAADAYRSFAAANPGLYPYTVRDSAIDDAEVRAASQEILDLLATTLRGYRLSGDEAVHAVRMVRSLLHGFAALELSGAYQAPPDMDASYGRLIETMDAGLRKLGN
jgi:AcrR family transcriptional regulator